MEIVLVGADIEENLGIGMIAAVATEAGHLVRVVTFDAAGQLGSVAERVMASDPDAVGLSVQFQHRGGEFMSLARRLRRDGYRGLLCCGGQFPSMAWREVLGDGNGVDCVVLHEGERTFVALLDAHSAGRRLAEVPGLAVLSDDGVPMRTAGNGLIDDLDALPFAARYRPHTIQYGVPFIPIMGSRGCWGRCTFCSITSCYRDAKSAGGPEMGGKLLRRRSPESIADEMALLCRGAGGEAIFCFHDDNFLLPKAGASLERVQRLRDALDARGVGKVAFVGKCRPDSTTPELLEALADLGLMRLYVGVENASQDGADHLNRKMTISKVKEALRSCRRANIFACYNLLLFEPRSTLEHVRENVAFIRDHAMHPINFCRAEPYYGTPLMLGLAESGALGGSYLGFSYRIEDGDTERLFRVCAAAFRQRNFDPLGVANRYMGLGYAARILETFYPDVDGRRSRIRRRADELTRSISLETASFLEEAMTLVEGPNKRDDEGLARGTALLGLRIAEADGQRHAELDDIFDEMNAFAQRARKARGFGRLLEPARRLSQMAPGIILVSTLIAGCNDGCSGQHDSVDPPPPDMQPVDPPPPPPDPLPPPSDPVPSSDYNRPPDHPLPPDPVPSSDYNRPPDHPLPPDPVPRPPDVQQPVDPAPRPPDVQQPMDPAPRPPDVQQPVDPPPPPPPPPDPLPPPSGQQSSLDRPDVNGSVSAAFRETTSWPLGEADELPLFRPPRIALSAHREISDGDEVIVVSLDSSCEPMSFRWESDGVVVGEGKTVTWHPESKSAQIRLAVRTEGGVAVTALRAVDVRS